MGEMRRASRPTLLVIALLFLWWLFAETMRPGKLEYYLGKAVGADTTIFAAHFSDYAFGRIFPGMKRREIESALGPPLAVSVSHCGHVRWYSILDGKQWIPNHQSADQGEVKLPVNECDSSKLREETVFHYTMSSTNKDYLVREVGFNNFGEVSFVARKYWAD